jgi:broad specificity phosphatase PhoE
MQKANRKFILVIVILLIGCWAGCNRPKEEAQPDPTTTVILIRHVERDNFFIVTPRGHKRAQALVDAVGNMGISVIYSPDLERNLDTVTPLANHLGLDITLTPRITDATVNQIANEILARHRGETVLLVGNGSGNLRALHQRLGGTGEGPYTYGDLFIYTIPDQGPVKVKKSRYGS